KGDHGFCSSDRPDYDDVLNGVEGALGYDRTENETSACNPSDHQWDVGAWGASSHTCSTTAFKTRPVRCERKFDGSTQPDSACSGTKPDTTKVEADYSSCSYTAVNATSWTPANTCSSNTTETRTFQCRRSNDGGKIVANSECTSRGVALSETRPTSNYSSCTYSAKVGSWGSWSSDCSTTAKRTRTVECLRSKGDIVTNSECTTRSEPPPSTSDTAARE